MILRDLIVWAQKRLPSALRRTEEKLVPEKIPVAVDVAICTAGPVPFEDREQLDDVRWRTGDRWGEP